MVQFQMLDPFFAGALQVHILSTPGRLYVETWNLDKPNPATHPYTPFQGVESILSINLRSFFGGLPYYTTIWGDLGWGRYKLPKWMESSRQQLIEK